MKYLGEDPNRHGLLDTPHRVLKSLAEMTRGYRQKPRLILERRFPVEHDQMVVLRGISFISLCEHHVLPFIGTADVAYIPTEEVVGLSKLARLVECFACRLQIQERLTNEICDTLWEEIESEGVGVVIRAHHSCMSCRGVRQSDGMMITSALRGRMKDDADTRAEFLSLARS